MLDFFKTVFKEFGEDRCTRIAAALAYSTAFSLAPLIILIISVAKIFLQPEDIDGQVESALTETVGPSGVEQINSMVEGAQGDQRRSIVSSIVGFVVILVGATGLFAQLQAAMNDVWEVKPDPRNSSLKYFIIKRMLSLGMVLSVAFLLVISLAITSLLHSFGRFIESWMSAAIGTTVLVMLNSVGSLIFLAVLFGAMFKFLPDAEIRWRDVAVGAVFTSILFTAGKFALGLYLGSKNMGTAYGAAGSLVLILSWVYYCSLIFMLGAEFTQVWAKKFGSGIEPNKMAVKVD